METTKTTSCQCGSSRPKKTKGAKRMSILNIITGVVFFLFPKCPFCWAAYASIFSFIGLDTLEYPAEWKYILLAIFLGGSLLLMWRHYKNRAWLNIGVYTLGFVVLLLAYYLNYTQSWWLYVVAFLIFLSNFHIQGKEWYLRLRSSVHGRFYSKKAEI